MLSKTEFKSLETLLEFSTYVRKWREAFQLVNYRDALNNFERTKQISLSNTLVEEEHNEYIEANNRYEKIDAIIDSVFVLIQCLDSYGIKFTNMLDYVKIKTSTVRDKMEVFNYIEIVLNYIDELNDLSVVDPILYVKEVYESNMSKMCHSKEELVNTETYYSNRGIKTNRNILGEGKYLVLRNSDKKVLKSVNFKEPDFEKVEKENSKN